MRGNVSRTVPKVLGARYVGFDSMVAKNFQITERVRAQFRWESVNTFNTPEFKPPNQTLGGRRLRVGDRRGQSPPSCRWG